LSYIVAKQRAKGEERRNLEKGPTPDCFAAEIADNACIGGDLLHHYPGDSGSAAMAIILGLNLTVPSLALETHHPGLIYFFYISLIVANFDVRGRPVIIKPGVKLFTMKKET
jgi:TctA family transporter